MFERELDETFEYEIDAMMHEYDIDDVENDELVIDDDFVVIDSDFDLEQLAQSDLFVSMHEKGIMYV